MLLDAGHATFGNAAQQRLAQVLVLHGGDGVVMQAGADTIGMSPATDHVRHALTNEFGTPIGQLSQAGCVPELGLGGLAAKADDQDSEASKQASIDSCHSGLFLLVRTGVPRLSASTP